MDYYRASEHIFMRENIQIDDTTQKSLIFGDYGEYIKTPGDMILVGEPLLISYDSEQNEGDSLFMRADTFQIFTLNRFDLSDSTAMVSATEIAEMMRESGEIYEREEHDHADHDHDEHAGHDHADHDHEHADHADHDHGDGGREAGGRSVMPGSGPGGGPRVAVGSQGGFDSERVGRPTPDALALPSSPDSLAQDTLPQDSLLRDSLSLDSLVLDSLQLDSLARIADTLNFWQRKKAQFLTARKERAAEKAIEDAARKVVLDSIGRERQKKINAKLDAEKVREARQIAVRRARIAEKETKRLRRDVARGRVSAADTAALMSALAVDTAALIRELANITEVDSLTLDSLVLDSLVVDSLVVDSLAVDSVKVDSLYRLTKGYRNVKIYRSDFQAVADSMVTSSIDSIIRLYINPILWHDANQVTSDVMDIYTSNSTIDKAIFTGGSPIMASEISPNVYYNQVAGKVITSLFADGQIYRNDADGNAQTIYFMQDDETKEVDGLMVMESGSSTFYIEEQQVVGITYRGEPNYILYPMNLIPLDQEMSLKGFSWQAERRPTREQLFNRVVRPSVREEKSEIERPQFPIYEELEANRNELIESGEWLDRTDLVSPQAEEWMESLGYKTGQPREQSTPQEEEPSDD